MKGRPPGTAKSEDPTKKKRKRQARERDLCDVKIKITEYFPGARQIMDKEAEASLPPEPVVNTNDDFFSADLSANVMSGQGASTQFPSRFPFIAPSDGSMTRDGTMRLNHQSVESKRYYTIQRVNGNGANGKTDGTAGPHKHSLEDSDRIKKNSVLRHVLKQEKEKKKSEVCTISFGCKAVIAAMLLKWRSLATFARLFRRGELRMHAFAKRHLSVVLCHAEVEVIHCHHIQRSDRGGPNRFSDPALSHSYAFQTRVFSL